MTTVKTILIVALSLFVAATAGCAESELDTAPEQSAPVETQPAGAETAAPGENPEVDDAAGYGHSHGDGHSHGE